MMLPGDIVIWDQVWLKTAGIDDPSIGLVIEAQSTHTKVLWSDPIRVTTHSPQSKHVRVLR